MPSRLTREERVTIEVLAGKGQNHSACASHADRRQIARTLGVTEGTVRYHLRTREGGGWKDGRQDKPSKADTVSGVIAAWIEAQEEGARPVNVKELYERLVYERGYEGSYRSVLRYVRRRYGKPAMRTYRRVETPPGAQAQTDWAEYPQLCVGDEGSGLHAFVMVLSHSRMPAVAWSEREDELAWLSCHNGALRRLRGVPAVKGDRQREDGDRPRSGGMGRDQPHLPRVRQGGALPRGCVSPWRAAGEGESGGEGPPVAPAHGR